MKKQVLLIAVLALALGLVGVSRSSAQGTPELDEELFVYNWDDYMDEDLIQEYEQQFGVRVTFDNYASNEELFTKLQSGATSYDVIFPSDYMVDRMIKLGLVARIDRNNVPNWQNIGQPYLDVWYDPEGYCLPWMWGTAGLAVNTTLERVPDSWAAIFDPEQAKYYAENGGINVLDDQRELLGAALKYLGYSYNETDPAKLAEARDLIINVLPDIRYINSADYQDTLLIPKEVLLSQSWSGSTAKVALQTATAENPLGEWRHITPKEGASRNQDSVCVTASSPRKATAEHFINFLHDAQNAARSANVTGYLSTNKAAQEFIKPELLSFVPPPEVLETLEWIRPLDEEALRLWDQTWTEIRASQ